MRNWPEFYLNSAVRSEPWLRAIPTRIILQREDLLNLFRFVRTIGREHFECLCQFRHAGVCLGCGSIGTTTEPIQRCSDIE